MRTNSPADRLAQHTFGRSVIIIGSLDWPDEPVFHAHGEHERLDEPVLRGWTRRTACGRLVYKATWDVGDDGSETVPGSYKSEDHGTNVHIAHAIRFARPCRQCFPDEAR
jgi:hypothetical protein